MAELELHKIQNDLQTGIKSIAGDEIHDHCIINQSRTTQDWYNDLCKLSEKIHEDKDESFFDWMASKNLMKSQNQQIKDTENLSSDKIRQRIVECRILQKELVDGILNMQEQVYKNMDLRKKLESLDSVIEIPNQINKDMFKILKSRTKSENVEDDLTIRLRKELECIYQSWDIVKEAIKNLNQQSEINHSLKNGLEKDFSSNKVAIELDRFAANLEASSVEKQYYENFEKHVNDYLTLDEWKDHATRNLKLVQQNAEASENLRMCAEKILIDVSRNLIRCSEHVDMSLRIRMNEVNNARLTLQADLCRIINEIRNQELNITYLKNAMRNKSDPVKLVQTRFHIREKRYGNDLVDDDANKQMLMDAENLECVINALREELIKAENILVKLRENQLTLEDEIEVKSQTLHKLKSQLLPLRKDYPSHRRLLGEDNQ